MIANNKGRQTNGSRTQGRTAAATITDFWYLGKYVTVMDAAVPAIAMGWKQGDTVVTNSQAAIARTTELRSPSPKPWIKELATRETGQAKKELLWIQGHSGIIGNNLADYVAKKGLSIGSARTTRILALRREYDITSA